MRRPRFHRWIRLETLRIANVDTFSLRKLAWQAQHDHNEALAASLLLYAHENDQIERLFSFIHDDALRAEYKEVEGHLGHRSVERLALRGSPMMQLPQQYRVFLERYALAYHKPENQASEKEYLRRSSADFAQKQGLSSLEVARALDVDPGNMHAYLVRGDIGRFTLAFARVINKYLQERSSQD